MFFAFQSKTASSKIYQGALHSPFSFFSFLFSFSYPLSGGMWQEDSIDVAVNVLQLPASLKGQYVLKSQGAIRDVDWMWKWRQVELVRVSTCWDLAEPQKWCSGLVVRSLQLDAAAGPLQWENCLGLCVMDFVCTTDHWQNAYMSTTLSITRLTSRQRCMLILHMSFEGIWWANWMQVNPSARIATA